MPTIWCGGGEAYTQVSVAAAAQSVACQVTCQVTYQDEPQRPLEHVDKVQLLRMCQLGARVA